MWLDKPEQWEKLAVAIRKAGEIGADTETYNQPDRTSPQHRTKIQCWSVGLLTGQASPRGFSRAVGAVMPRASLDHPALRSVIEDRAVKKYFHNAPHDVHSFMNEGIQIANAEDSLQWLRVAVPGMGDYGLKSAEQWALGYGPRPGFLDMVKHTVQVVTARARKEQGCICGKKPCRARSTSDFLCDDGVWRPHLRVTWKVFSPIARDVEARYDIREFTPEHPRWDAWIQYSLADAVRGIELVSWIRNRKPARVAYPWSGIMYPGRA